jgi:hypothetical protein
MPFDGYSLITNDHLVVLRNARNLILTSWCQHNYHVQGTLQSHYCAVGAYRAAAISSGCFNDLNVIALDDIFAPMLSQSLPWYTRLLPSPISLNGGIISNYKIITYNDSWLRRKKHILKVYDKAIRRLEASLLDQL